MNITKGVNDNSRPADANYFADKVEDSEDMDMEDANPSSNTVRSDLEHDSTYCVPVAALVEETEGEVTIAMRLFCGGNKKRQRVSLHLSV